jgi:hypothetical protein
MRCRPALALAGMLILSACVVARVDIAVDANGLVNGSASIAYRIGFLEDSGLDPGDAQDALLADLTDDGVDGMACVPFRNAETVGASCTLTDVPIAELSQLDAFDRRVTIARVDDRIVVDSVIDLTELPGDPDPSSDLDAVITVIFPGPIVEQSGGEVTGTAVSWAPRLGERVEAHAVAEAAPRDEPADLLLVAVILALVAVASVGTAGFALGRLRGTDRVDR